MRLFGFHATIRSNGKEVRTMKKSILTRGLGVMTAAVMCLALFPTTALAADYDDFEIENGVLTGYTIRWEPEYEDGYTYYDDGTAVDRNQEDLKKISSQERTVVVPDGVTSIGAKAFSFVRIERPLASYGAECKLNIILPDSITSIGDYAFSECYNLKSISIPNSVTSIGSNAFYNCKDLTSITLPEGLTTIGDRAFEYCDGLTTVKIPDGVATIGEYAFFDCENLTTINIPTSLTKISDGMFGECSNITGHITVPDGITSIGSSAFSGTGITSVTIPESVTVIGAEGMLNSLVVPTGTAIHGVPGSIAEAHAKTIHATFIPIGGSTTPSAADRPSAWAEAQVNGAIAANLVPQDLQSQYTQATTRAEFCALATALYETATGAEITQRAAFLDTTDLNVQKMAGLGVVSGVGDGRFDPDGKLTREQAATMLSRLANALGKPLTAQAPTFADNASISAWALDAVGQVQAAGIMGGVGDNAFAPQSDYTREQSILTIGRLYELVKA